jgi:hypothetical protein
VIFLIGGNCLILPNLLLAEVLLGALVFFFPRSSVWDMNRLPRCCVGKQWGPSSFAFWWQRFWLPVLPSVQVAQGGFIVLEVRAPGIFVGKSLEVLDLRKRFGATVLTIKRETDEREDKISYLLPTSSTITKEGDVLIIFGLQKDLSRSPHY